MAQVMKVKREENILVLSERLVLFTESLSQTINNKLLVWRLYTCSVYVMNSMLLPRFSIFANLCRSAEFFLQGSAKIVALNLEDPYRSTRFLQKCSKIFAEICFSAASKEPIYCIFGLLQLLYQVF